MSAANRAPGEGSVTQRLDKWLWFVRVVKTRTLAAALVTDGKVRVNRQRVTKPGYAVRGGDVITIAGAGRIRFLKVVAIGARRGPPSEAVALYEEVAPAIPKFASHARADSEPEVAVVKGSGRPTKRERRLRRELIAKGRTAT